MKSRTRTTLRYTGYLVGAVFALAIPACADNGYFTIFDGEADGGRGVIKFAAARYSAGL